MGSLNEFLGQMKGGGARANQFKVIMNTPNILTVDQDAQRKATFMIKAAQLPGQTIGEIAVPFRGRNLYIPGDREFETWTTTVINDTDFGVRNIIEQWMNGISDLENGLGAINPSAYQADLEVEQLDRAGGAGDSEGVVLKRYTLVGCWPTTLGAIDLSYETQNEIEQFEITWRYQHFTVSDS